MRQNPRVRQQDRAVRRKLADRGGRRVEERLELLFVHPQFALARFWSLMSCLCPRTGTVARPRRGRAQTFVMPQSCAPVAVADTACAERSNGSLVEEFSRRA